MPLIKDLKPGDRIYGREEVIKVRKVSTGVQVTVKRASGEAVREYEDGNEDVDAIYQRDVTTRKLLAERAALEAAAARRRRDRCQSLPRILLPTSR